MQNITGLQLEQSNNVVVKNSLADSNIHAGFDLLFSSTNCFIDCKALATGFGNTIAFENMVAGFVSSSGAGNIFERCIANATQALSTIDQNSLVAGFVLRGSEQCTKIINSESANATASADGFTVPYGILLESTTTQNIIKDNIVYDNQHEVLSTSTSIGIGISASSCNLVIGNVAYNNVDNYQFVTNVFNPLFGIAPSALQNISLAGCEPINAPTDLGLIAKQNLYKACLIAEFLVKEFNSRYKFTNRLLSIMYLRYAIECRNYFISRFLLRNECNCRHNYYCSQ